MLLLIAIAFLLKRYGTQAVPLPAPSPTSAALEAPIFARDNASDGCQGRSVLDILWSCLATTFACSWVSVHPNVPFKEEGKWTLLGRRIFLMFFSILAPEFMIMWAFKQWRGAVMIRDTVNEAIRKASTDKSKPVRELWTTAHGHLLQLGGLRLNATARENFFWEGSTDLGKRSERPLQDVVNDDDPRFAYIMHVRRRLDYSQKLGYRDEREIRSRLLRNLISTNVFYRHETSSGSWSSDYAMDYQATDDIWECVLTIDALERLLYENLINFPTITEDEINDKSKGDALSKGIALLQLTWFIVQIITRVVQGLAISELELTTAALAGLNSIMYIFWWSKPRDVRFPVIIRTKGVEELLAKRAKDNVTWSFPNSDSELDQEFDIRKHLWLSMAPWIKARFVALVSVAVSLPFQLISILLKSVETAKTFPRQLTPFFSRVRIQLSRTRKPTTSENRGEMVLAVDVEPPRKSDDCTKRCALMLVHGAKSVTKFASVPFFCLLYIIDVVLFIPIAAILISHSNGSISGILFDEVGGFNVDAEGDIFSMLFYSQDAGIQPLLGTSSIAGAMFGALHCLAWHFSFPSHAEQILWRIASLGVVGSCAVIFQTVLCFRNSAGSLMETARFLWTFVGLLLCGLSSFIYPVARITLLVLAITSLRSLPPSAFETVDWVELVPHI